MSAPSLGTNRSRRSFLKQSAASTLLALTPAGRMILAQEPVDLLITGGRLIDPWQRGRPDPISIDGSSHCFDRQ